MSIKEQTKMTVLSVIRFIDFNKDIQNILWPNSFILITHLNSKISFIIIIQPPITTSIVKNMFGFSILYCTAFYVDDKSYIQVMTQFSAPFKAGNSRQVQICYKPTIQTQRKLQHFLVYTGTGETGVLVTLKHQVST